MNKIFALTLAMAFAGTAHAQIAAHAKGAAGIVNKATVPTQNAQRNALTATGTTGNATAPRNEALACIQPNAPKKGSTTSIPCHPTKTAQL